MILAATDGLIAIIYGIIAVYAFRQRGHPGAFVLSVLFGVLTSVAVCASLLRVSVLPYHLGLAGVVGGWMVAVPLWIGSVGDYTGRGPQITRRRAGLALGYVVILAAGSFGTVDLSGVWQQSAQLIVSVLQTGHIAAGLFAVFLVGRSTLRYGDLTHPQAVTLVIGGLGISVLVLTVGGLGESQTGLPLGVSIVLGSTAAAFAGGVLGTNLLDETPGIGPLARRSAIAEMSECVLVTDPEGRLVDANRATEMVFDVDIIRDVGKDIAAVLGFDPAEAHGEVTKVSTPAGHRQVNVRQSMVHDRSGETVGTAYLLRDVSDRQTRQQQLAVLSRILRHNIRNDLDAIRGFAEALEEAEQNGSRMAKQIQTTASELANVGETVQRANRVVTRDDLNVETVEITGLLNEVSSALRDRHGGVVNIEDVNVTVQTDRELLRMALYEVIENAIEHGGEEPSTPTVTATRRQEGIRVTVADDGPGIAEQEMAVIQEGEEAPLRHGTGLGLWVTSWALTRLGGSVEFETDPDGTIVQIDVPSKESASPTG